MTRTARPAGPVGRDDAIEDLLRLVAGLAAPLHGLLDRYADRLETRP